MLELAADAGKPVLIHDRDAHEEVLAAVSGVPGSRGVMHCFSGDAGFARRCADRGLIVSFSGIVTFPRAEGIQDAARTVAPSGFVVETNSPFLSPVPERGKPNLPERVAITAAAVARLRGETVAEVRASTTRTARRRARHRDPTHGHRACLTPRAPSAQAIRSTSPTRRRSRPSRDASGFAATPASASISSSIARCSTPSSRHSTQAPTARCSRSAAGSERSPVRWRREPAGWSRSTSTPHALQVRRSRSGRMPTSPCSRRMPGWSIPPPSASPPAGSRPATCRTSSPVSS